MEPLDLSANLLRQRLNLISAQRNKVYNSVLVSYIARRERDRMRKTLERIVLLFPIIVMMLSLIQTAYPSSVMFAINAEQSCYLGERAVVRCT
jgi:hypothetical protein